MLPRVRWQTRVSDALTLMAHLIKARSRIGMNDASIVLEAIVRNVLNETFDWNLQNLNIGGPNHPAADLGDTKKREAVQVTVQDSGTKISHTVRGVIANNIAQRYKRLTIFFFLPKKPAIPRSLELPKNIAIETMDIADLTQCIGQISNISKLERITNIVENEVGRILSDYRSETAAPHPAMHARFQEDGNKLIKRLEKSDGEVYASYSISLWIENAPPETEKVVYEILHESFLDSPWTIKRRKKVARDFETDDFESYGDVDIYIRGKCRDVPDWRLRTSLYEALVNEYSSKPTDKRIAKAIRHIRDN